MSKDIRLARLEQALGPEPVFIRVLRVPVHRWTQEPPLSALEVAAFTTRVLGPFYGGTR